MCGINSHAEEWYDDLDAFEKQVFQIKSGFEFYNLLLNSNLIVSSNTIINKLNELIQKEILGQELVYYKNNWYYIQLLGKENIDSTVILNAHGQFVDNFTCQEIRKQHPHLKRLTLILLESRMEVLKILLNNDELTMKDISKELKIKQADIQATINNLVEQNLLEECGGRNKKFRIKRGLESFLKISNEFKEKSSLFMRSNYFHSSITPELMNFITNRFVITLTTQKLDSIKKLITISPSSLEYCLRSPTVPDQTSIDSTDTHIAMTNKFRIQDLFSHLCVLTLSDMEQRRSLQLDLMNGVMTKIHLKFATPDDLYLDIRTKYSITIMQASGHIEPNSFVRPANPEGFVTWASLHYNLGQTSRAAEMLEYLLNSKTNNGTWTKVAYINLGFYKSELNKLKDAEYWLLCATREYPDATEGWLNLGNVYLAMDKITNAEEIFRQELTKNPTDLKIQYGLARVLIRRDEVDQCVSVLKKILEMNMGFVKLINKHKEFKEFKQSIQYKELIKNLKTQITT